ncbi:MAG: DUF7305 domain-containing protein [Limisphaerales bacterium]
MKIRSTRNQGSALLVTLVITAILGTALASYMKLAEYQNRSVVRSQYWNGGIPVAEAGVEEALAHLNKVSNGNRAVHGWVLTNNQFYLSRTLNLGRYEVWINDSAQPTIQAIGYVVEPLSGKEVQRKVRVTATKAGSLMRGLLAKESITMNGGGTRVDSFDSTDPNLSNNGRYDSAKANDMGFAGAVYGNINTGNGGVWGYAATGPNGNFTGTVGDAAWMAAQNGAQPGHYAKDLNVSFPEVTVPFTNSAFAPMPLVATITNYTYLSSQTTSATYPSPEPPGGVTTSVQPMTTATKPNTWSGVLTTNLAPTSSTVYPTAGTYVGNVVTRNVVEGNGKNKKTVAYYDYTRITGYTYNTTAYTYNTITTNTTTTTESYAYATGTGNYRMNSLSLSGQNKFLVHGDTVLHILGSLSLSGQAQIVIMPGASLKLYVGGGVALHGNGVMNLAQNALSFQVMGLPTCTSIDFGGNAAFTGVVYAPNAHVQMGGGGSNTYDTVGAVTAKSIGLNGHFNFHYDEMLGRVSGPDLYKVASWNEI